MKLEKDREKQVYYQVMHGLRDIIRHLDDIGAEKHADLGRDLHAAMTRLRQDEFLKKDALTMEDLIRTDAPK